MASASVPEILIRPPRRWSAPDLRELWEARELLYFITKRELQVRYKQSAFGIGWAILQPVALALLFALVFGRLANVPSEGLPYPLFALAGLTSWVFANQGFSQGAASLLSDANLLTKVSFPRLVLPLGRILALLVDLVLALCVLAVAMALYGVPLRATALIVPLFLLLALITTAGLAILFGAINVRYRDVSMAIPLLGQLWLFATPVIYPGSLITGAWQYLYAVNPMVSVIQGMRWALLGVPGPSIGMVVVSTVTAVVLLVAAVMYFRRVEQFFADVI